MSMVAERMGLHSRNGDPCLHGTAGRFVGRVADNVTYIAPADSGTDPLVEVPTVGSSHRPASPVSNRNADNACAALA